MSSSLVFEALTELHLVISCQNRQFPTDAEWDSWLNAVANVERLAKQVRLLVASEGGHPTKAQLDRLRAANRSNPRTAIVSPSRAYRFMASALTFINPTIRCYSPAQYDRAFDHIGLAHADRERALLVIERLNPQLAHRSSAA